jgi:hypothetical protein
MLVLPGSRFSTADVQVVEVWVSMSEVGCAVVRTRLHMVLAARRAGSADPRHRSLVLFPPLFVDAQSFGELVFQDDDPAGRVERSALVDEFTGARR